MSSDGAPLREQVPGQRNLLTDALVGGLVTLFVSFVPFSPVVGGTVAGYLHQDRGPRVGGLSGLFASIPLVMLVVLVLVVLGFGVVVPGGVDGAVALFAFLAFVLSVALFVAAVNVVLGAVGGVLGVALAEREARGRAAPADAVPAGSPRSEDRS